MSVDLIEHKSSRVLDTESDRGYFEVSIEDQPGKLSPSEKFAKDAISRFFAWLEDSPNNATYHKSNAYLLPTGWLREHQTELQQDIQSRHEHINYELKWKDRQNLDNATNMYEAYDVAFAGIELIITAAQNHNIDKPVEKINQSIIAAIGATTVRMEYLSDVLTPGEESSFENTYRQNILSDIRHAAQLESWATNSNATSPSEISRGSQDLAAA